MKQIMFIVYICRRSANSVVRTGLFAINAETAELIFMLLLSVDGIILEEGLVKDVRNVGVAVIES